MNTDLSDKLTRTFSEITDGIIWNIIADEENQRLFLEVRDPQKKQVSFYAADLIKQEWILKHITFEDPWWISLLAVSGEMMLLTLYTDTNNPDKKGLLAYDISRQSLSWWRNGFAVSEVGKHAVRGFDQKFGGKEITLRLEDGSVLAEPPQLLEKSQNFPVIRPFQYAEGTAHFETLKAFLEKKIQISPTISIEYCEYHTLILISVFVRKDDLANYLFVFNSAGELKLKENLGEHLKGIAFDTFFIFSGYLIFVKNKNELVSYKLL